MPREGALPLRKVVVVNTADEGGGAERMSMAVLDGFAALGTETWLLVGQKRTGHPRVLTLHQSPFFDYRPYASPWRRAAREVGRAAERWMGLEDFRHPYSRRVLELTGPAPDLVLCHNLHGGYFDLRALRALSRRAPVVVRLFDSWLLTGHCAYPLGCPRWRHGCGRCPDLALPPAVRRDATRINWRRKRRALRGAKLFVSAESEWMLDRARRSLLAPAAAGWRLIRGGVDLETFAPGSRVAARRALGLAPGALLVLFVANLGPENPFKDFATVRRAVRELARREPGRALELIAVGADGPEERLAPGAVLRRAGYVRSPERLAAFYRAADVYVHAAREETFGVSVAEALACGAPVVLAAAGGVLEAVDPGRTALVVPPGRPAELADALAALASDPSRRAALGRAGAAAARAHLDRRHMISALHEWCSEILAAWRRPVPLAGR
jgi:glycosyltransferase involved in cell wall biosynthesis